MPHPGSQCRAIKGSWRLLEKLIFKLARFDPGRDWSILRVSTELPGSCEWAASPVQVVEGYQDQLSVSLRSLAPSHRTVVWMSGCSKRSMGHRHPVLSCCTVVGRGGKGLSHRRWGERRAKSPELPPHSSRGAFRCGLSPTRDIRSVWNESRSRSFAAQSLSRPVGTLRFSFAGLQIRSSGALLVTRRRSSRAAAEQAKRLCLVTGCLSRSGASALRASHRFGEIQTAAHLFDSSRDSS
jgi:hypothetical protein